MKRNFRKRRPLHSRALAWLRANLDLLFVAGGIGALRFTLARWDGLPVPDALRLALTFAVPIGLTLWTYELLRRKAPADGLSSLELVWRQLTGATRMRSIGMALWGLTFLSEAVRQFAPRQHLLRVAVESSDGVGPVASDVRVLRLGAVPETLAVAPAVMGAVEIPVSSGWGSPGSMVVEATDVDGERAADTVRLSESSEQRVTLRLRSSSGIRVLHVRFAGVLLDYLASGDVGAVWRSRLGANPLILQTEPLRALRSLARPARFTTRFGITSAHLAVASGVRGMREDGAFVAPGGERAAYSFGIRGFHSVAERLSGAAAQKIIDEWGHDTSWTVDRVAVDDESGGLSTFALRRGITVDDGLEVLSRAVAEYSRPWFPSGSVDEEKVEEGNELIRTLHEELSADRRWYRQRARALQALGFFEEALIIGEAIHPLRRIIPRQPAMDVLVVQNVSGGPMTLSTIRAAISRPREPDDLWRLDASKAPEIEVLPTSAMRLRDGESVVIPLRLEFARPLDTDAALGGLLNNDHIGGSEGRDRDLDVRQAKSSFSTLRSRGVESIALPLVNACVTDERVKRVSVDIEALLRHLSTADRIAGEAPILLGPSVNVLSMAVNGGETRVRPRLSGSIVAWGSDGIGGDVCADYTSDAFLDSRRSAR